MLRSRLVVFAALPTLLMALVVPSAPAAADDALAWTTCADASLAKAGFDCATLTAPLDRRDPGSGTVDIAVTRHGSTGSTSERIGSLFFNPGGPGGPGLTWRRPYGRCCPRPSGRASTS